MRVALLSHDLSSNALGRAYVLALACRPFAEVTIWGPLSTGRPWPPLAEDRHVPLRHLRIRNHPLFGYDARRAAREIRRHADLVYAVKPRMGSYGLGRIARHRHQVPLVLDIDDWELGFALAGGVRWKILANGVLHANAIDSYFPTRRLDRLARGEPHKTVSNRFLQQRFGGVIIPHGRDPNLLDPARVDARTSKSRLGLEGLRTVMFFGTPRPHKGVEELVEAVAAIPDSDVVCVIVGARPEDSYAQGLAARAPGRVRILGERPFDQIAETVAAADICVVPQRAELGTVGQTPAKVFDAMAMAKPIVATRAGDLPTILEDGCGLLVEPNSAAALREGLVRLLENPKEGAEMGRRARERLVRDFSLDVMTRRLQPLLEAALASRHSSTPGART